MNHNFLPFDICEMLPKENPYAEYYNLAVWYLNDKDKIKLVDYTHYWNNLLASSKLRDSYTILDALIWIEEQGYVITVEFIEDVWDNNLENKINCFIVFVRNTKTRTINHINPKIKYNSRIEAYTEGIKHCLNLLKDESNRTTKTNF